MLLPGGVGTSCLKCGHTRSAGDPGPEYECPKCGAVYAKLEAARQAREDAQVLRRERAPAAVLAEEHGSELLAGRLQERNLGIFAHLVYLLFVLPTGLTALAGVIMAHVMKGRAAGTHLQSHFRWQINTFWGALAMALLLYGVGDLLLLLAGPRVAGRGMGNAVMGAIGGTFVFAAVMLLLLGWCIYRVVKGWYQLVQGEEIA